MPATCTHLDLIDAAVEPSGPGCVECLAEGGRWLHLRRCATCGHVGCCDSSPARHGSAHARETGHPIAQSYEPGEDWLWCYVDEVAFEVSELTPSTSHPPGWSPGPPADR
jgi:hypothetical protein